MYIKKEKLDSVSSDTSEHSSCDDGYSPERYHHPGMPYPPFSTSRVKRLRANDRERRRVHLINCAMDALRNIVPGLKDKRKLTKLELLRAANHYIWVLDESLRTGKSLDQITSRPPVEEPPIPVYFVRYDMPILKRESP